MRRAIFSPRMVLFVKGGRPPRMQRSESAGLTRFLHRISGLKFTFRTGWLDRGVPPASTESVADHSFRMTLLAWLAALEGEPALDADRVLKLALIHDLAE